MRQDICVRFGRRLRQLRQQRQFTQEELAYRAGMDVNYLSHVERAKKEPCLRSIGRLAKALDITAAELLLEV